MEILRRGTPPEEKKYECTCRNCTTFFKFMRKEAKYISDQRDGDCLVIDCPICGSRCSVDLRHN